MRSREHAGHPVAGSDERTESTGEHPVVASTMAVSIVGVSTACSKDALVSSARAAREALSGE